MPDPLIVVPDDFPSVFEKSAAHERAAKLGDLRVYSQRGADVRTPTSVSGRCARIALMTSMVREA